MSRQRWAPEYVSGINPIHGDQLDTLQAILDRLAATERHERRNFVVGLVGAIAAALAVIVGLIGLLV